MVANVKTMNFLKVTTVCFGILASVLLSGGCGGGGGGDSHTHVFDQSVVADKYVRTKGSCTEETTYFKSCSCGEASTTDYFSTGVKHVSNIIERIKISGAAPVAEYKCLDCGKATEEAYFDSELKQLPVVNLHGTLPESKAQGKVKVSADYYDGKMSFESYATLKVQGGTSANKPKKNYNIQLYKDNSYDKKNKVTLVENWGKQSKYTLKANWAEYSQSRNVVAGKIYGKIAKSLNLGDGLEKAPNGGTVDGFPVMVFHEGEFLGLYTLNIAKDDWMYGMKKDDLPESALLLADNHLSPAIYLTKDIVNIKEDDPANDGFVCEYQGTSATDDKLIASFNTFTRALRTVDSKESLFSKVNANTLKRAIDTMLFTYVIRGEDNTAHNIMYATYDGKVWLPSMYDMDLTFGLAADNQGEVYFTWKGVEPSKDRGTLLWRVLYKYDYDEVVARYEELRKDILSYDNIVAEFEAFFAKIPEIARRTERKKWPGVSLQDTNNIDQIKDFTKNRLEYLDGLILKK